MVKNAPGKRKTRPKMVLPLAMDFCSPQTEEFTRISRFFQDLKKGRFTTTKCKKCGTLNWPPRVVCAECQSDELKWVVLPKTGTLWAFTELRMGAPLGMEHELPYSIGIVELDTVGLRLLTRINTPYDKMELGMHMELVVVNMPGNRVFYRFKSKKV